MSPKLEDLIALHQGTFFLINKFSGHCLKIQAAKYSLWQASPREVNGWQRVPKGFKVGKGYIQVQRLAKGTLRSEVGKRYIKVQRCQGVPKGPKAVKGYLKVHG